MSKYSKVLLAVDFAADNITIIDRAKEVIADSGARLYLVHVHEPTVTAYQIGGMASWSTQAVSLDDEIRKVEDKKMAALSAELGVQAEHCFLPFGKAAVEIRKIAVQEKMDLIVIGTHGRQGLALLLGSTANGVLHGSSCDVLAVRTH